MATIMRRLFVTIPLVWVVGVAPVAARCTADLAFYNLSRGIHGDVNAECPEDPGPHSVPWGNWGVDSNYGGREDGHQFPGWEPQLDGTYEWNSCTRILDPNHFNARQWTQVDRGTRNLYAVARHQSPSGYTCESWLSGGLYTIVGEFMKLYELDGGGIFFGGDDWVTTLLYSGINIPVTCTGPWACTGWSAAVSPYSGTADVTADIQLYVRLYRR